MIVVNYADFVSNSQKYVNLAKVQGLKIKAEKKSKFSRKQQKLLDSLESVTGILPSDVDFEKAKYEEILKH